MKEKNIDKFTKLEFEKNKSEHKKIFTKEK